MSVPEDVIEGAAGAAAAAYITLWPVEQSANAFALMQREHAIAMVRAALAALEAAGWKPVKLEEVVDAAYAKGRADALEEAAQMAEVDARAISKGTYGRMGSTTAIGDHIAQAIRAIASIESAAMLTASRQEKPDV